ncbi:MAG: hypothetical protein WBD36_15655 [Bacteroidota bacterium]
MKTLLKICCIILVGGSVVHAKDVFEKEEIRKTLKFADHQGPSRVLLDNINGSVNVVGHDGNDVELVAHKSIRAESSDKIREAKEDVKLEIKEERDRISVVVVTPWRNENGEVHYHGYRWYGYEVTIDFELKVPKNCMLFVKTINEGEITTKDFEGDFEIKNVNGGITMTGAAGSGKVTTVNGPVNVTFRKNPASDCRFHTVNGTVEVEFQDMLSADFVLKTFNGKVYTDYDIVHLPRKEPTFEQGKRKKVYRSGESFAVRVREGGPELAFETLNGDIRILKHQ